MAPTLEEFLGFLAISQEREDLGSQYGDSLEFEFGTEGSGRLRRWSDSSGEFGDTLLC